MEKVVNEDGKLVLKRTEFMQWVSNSTYSKMVPVAILNPGTSLQQAWEHTISEFLQSLYKSKPLHRPKILELLAETGVEGITANAFDKAAEMVLESKIQDNT